VDTTCNSHLIFFSIEKNIQEALFKSKKKDQKVDKQQGTIFKSKKKGQKVNKQQGTIQFKLQFIPTANVESNEATGNGPIALLMEGTSNDVDHMQVRQGQLSALEGLIGEVDTAAQDMENTYEVWQPLLERINTVVEVVDTISEVVYLQSSGSSLFLTFSDQIHPYVRMAWSVLSLPVDVSGHEK
jgi:hypothetical protein